MERTFGIIKPNSVKANQIGGILDVIERGGLRVVATKTLRLTQTQAEGFYAVHRERPFFASLCTFMCSGPIVALVLEGPNAVARYREIMGATDPAKAAEGTIRKRFAKNIEENSVHGSDSADNAKIEIAYFFAQSDLNGLVEPPQARHRAE